MLSTARTRAKVAAALTVGALGSHELGSAQLADPLLGASALVSMNHEQLAISNDGRARPLAVATEAGRREVGRVVVAHVPIKMVNDKRARFVDPFGSVHPPQGFAAPPARMRALSERLVKHPSCAKHLPAVIRKRVIAVGHLMTPRVGLTHTDIIRPVGDA